MTTRDKILEAVRQAQPAYQELREPEIHIHQEEDLAAQFSRTLKAIGGQVYDLQALSEIFPWVIEHLDRDQRVISMIPELSEIAEGVNPQADPHSLEDIGLAIVQGQFGVAENGAIWVTEENMGVRVLPFICQHLALIINKKDIVGTLHTAYARINHADYGFGTFIAGPSKTADIEQSLVLGAHGPISLSVFILEE